MNNSPQEQRGGGGNHMVLKFNKACSVYPPPAFEFKCPVQNGIPLSLVARVSPGNSLRLGDSSNRAV
jgi:hypothetical protein